MSSSPGGVPYLNSHIVLISKSEIRYEGTLYTIDTSNSTVALQNVRSFGTEDRKTDNPIPASPEVFDYIIFRGADIKDLHVCEPPATPAAPQPAAQPLPQPAAPPLAAAPPPAELQPAQPPAAWGANPSQARSTSAAQAQPAVAGAACTSTATPTAGLAAPVAPVAPMAPAAPVANVAAVAATAATAATAAAPSLSLKQPANARRSQPGTGAHITQRASRGVNGGPLPTTTDSEEFDFQKMLEGFDKNVILQEASNKVKESAGYNKTSSFFDTLDEEVETDGARRGRAFMQEMRKVDAETFGEELIRDRRGGGRGRGRGRGDGRGRGGSRGGGGYGGGGYGGGGGGGAGGAGGAGAGYRGSAGGYRGPATRDSETFGDMASGYGDRRGGGNRRGRGGGRGDGADDGGRGRGGGASRGRGGGQSRGRGGSGSQPMPVPVTSSA